MPVESSSDQDFACFACGKWFSKNDGEICPTCNLALNAARSLEGANIDGYVLEEYKARGFYGATFRASNRIGKKFAIKLCPKVLYDEHGKDFDSEIRRHRELGAHPNIGELVDAGSAASEIGGITIPVYYVVMEWIDGVGLKEFIAKPDFTVSEMYGLIVDLCSGIARFEKCNLWHNDLKADNILVKRLSDEELDSRVGESQYIAKIIDTGSAVFRQSEKHKTVDDIRFLAQHINKMRSRLLDKTFVLPHEDRFFIDGLGPVIATALDEHPSRSFQEAHGLLTEVKALYERRRMLDEEIEVQLSDPFVYLNANDFPGEEYVNLLFASFPWLETIVSTDPQSMLIVGPRGSGKTILLKSLNLKTRLHRHRVDESVTEIKQRVTEDKFAAFFVSARIEIGNHCPLTKLPSWAMKDAVVNLHFNLLYAYVVVDTLDYARAKALIHIEPDGERELCKYIPEAAGLPPARSFGATASNIQEMQRRIMNGSYGDAPTSEASGPAFLTNLCAIIRSRFAYFRSRHVIFLLDDFSLPKVPREIQQYLLPTIWNSGGGYTFRVTAHSESVALQDVNGVTYAHNREFREENLGASYINRLDEKRVNEVQQCLEAIFTKRFDLTPEFKGRSVADILGASDTEAIGQAIRRLHIEKKLRTLKYYGWETVVKLCSGDISYVLDILSSILRGQPAKYPVGKIVQNNAIRRYARSELYRTQDVIAGKCNLYEVALNFGKFSKFKLLNNSVGAEKRPAEYLRLEVEIENLSQSAKDALGDLLRNGIFVDGGFSASSRGTPARRLIFKKLFTPAFPTTYVNRDTWPMSSRHFDDFTNDPKGFVKKIMAEHGVPLEQQIGQLESLMDNSMD